MRAIPVKDARELGGTAGGENKSTNDYTQNPSGPQTIARELLAMIAVRLHLAHESGNDRAVENLLLIRSRIGASLNDGMAAR